MTESKKATKIAKSLVAAFNNHNVLIQTYCWHRFTPFPIKSQVLILVTFVARLRETGEKNMRQRGCVRTPKRMGTVIRVIMAPTRTNGQRYPHQEAMIPPKNGPAVIPRQVIDAVRPYALP